MNGFWEMVKGWDTSIQVGAFAVVALFVTIVLCQMLRTLRVVLRGYPPPEPAEQRIQECSHESSLTGRCLKPGGCKTTEECQTVITKHNNEG